MPRGIAMMVVKISALRASQMVRGTYRLMICTTERPSL